MRAWGANKVGAGEGVGRPAEALKVGAGETALQWADTLSAAQERFLVSTEAEEDEAQRIRAALKALATQARAARCE
ncbi:MAG: hypothetical protein Q8J72_02765, partial [Rhodocyclaceae bacterium]|nr:hypothetical protein [Rhodocyclaceae bacterium]